MNHFHLYPCGRSSRSGGAKTKVTRRQSDNAPPPRALLELERQREQARRLEAARLEAEIVEAQRLEEARREEERAKRLAEASLARTHYKSGKILGVIEEIHGRLNELSLSLPKGASKKLRDQIRDVMKLTSIRSAPANDFRPLLAFVRAKLVALYNSLPKSTTSKIRSQIAHLVHLARA